MRTLSEIRKLGNIKYEMRNVNVDILGGYNKQDCGAVDMHSDGELNKK